MVQIGKINRLEIVEIAPNGVCFDGGDDGQIWAPSREDLRGLVVGESAEVFVYYDSQDCLVATKTTPLAAVDQFAFLQVTSLQQVGAFLNWGLPKELFLPFREQTRELQVGDKVCVFLYLDKSQRISASMRIEKYVDRRPSGYERGQAVDLLVTSETDLGYKAIVNERYLGVLYRNEIFQPIHVGQRVKGFIQKMRDDDKIDLSLTQAGYLEREDIGQRILALLETRGGFLPVGDKASAEVVYDLFGVSKKKYKMAIGTLYKKKLITIAEDGIRSVS